MGKSKQSNGNTSAFPTPLVQFGEEREIIGVDDMVLLSSVTENAVLENLKMRHAGDVIYSYIGHVLVVVNPYKWLNIYNEETMHAYMHKSRIDVPPHVFATAEETYRTMLNEEDNQCVIISGESGAGKTEASKQIQNYIAGVSGSGAGVDKVKRTFLESNPLLEAFGNAKTLRNNNSSRFGKYFELFFDQAGRPQGGKVTNYLLEKSRVVQPGKGERNFHIFYQVLKGLPSPAKEKLYLSNQAEHFQFLSASGCYQVEDVNDELEFQETMQAMQHVGIKRKQIELVLQTIAAILHLGNVEFLPKAVGDAEGSCLKSKKDIQSLQIFCELVGLDANALEHALCFKMLQTMAPGGKIETYEVPQNPSQAKAQRDSIAKNLYERLFDFLVERVNHALDVEKKFEKCGEAILTADQMTTIGILDIYGFEIFEKNGFEQFCINYVNEKLQQIFIELTLKSEQEEYEREGIAWKPIPFFNNKVVCDLIEAKKPIPGIFLILDDTVKTMHSRQGESVDATFLEKVASFHQSHAHFSKRGRTFEIKHYAGDVQYSIDRFGDSNKDFLSKDIALIISKSTNKLIKYIFPEEIDLLDKKMPHTAGYKIRTQCETLVNALMDCTPHYVRCIKSNDQKQAHKIDDRRVVHQIKYLGLLENIKVRRAGYAYRGEYGRFVDRFRLLSKETYPRLLSSKDKKNCQAILKSAMKNLPSLEKEVQLGKTMVFIQTPETFFQLERLREQVIGNFVSKIQRAYRKYASRRHLLTLSNEIAKLYQAHRKERQRVSIYRPFDAYYLLENEEIQGAVMKLLEHYGDDPSRSNILFMDNVYKICQKSGGSSSKEHDTFSNPIALSSAGDVVNANMQVDIQARILVLTREALYLMEKRNWQVVLKDPKSTWTPPLVYMRRRIPVREIEEIMLSSHVDPFFGLKVNAASMTPLATPDKSSWLEDKTVLCCMDTGRKFGLFHRRHHCRYTGKIYCSDVCKQLEVLPDKGFYTPQRVHDSAIGLICTEVMEDQLLFSEKKTEIGVMLIDAIKHKTNKVIPISFQNKFQLQTSSITALSTCPRQEILFQTCTNKKTSIIKMDGDAFSLQIHVPPGVPEEYIKKRRKRERARRKKLEKQREEEAQMRAMRQAQREKIREEKRARRVAERKAKKQAERETRRQSSLSGQASKAKNLEGARRFGESLGGKETNDSKGMIMMGGANSELAAILAKRRAAA